MCMIQKSSFTSGHNIALWMSQTHKDKTAAMPQSEDGNSVTTQNSPVNVRRLRASSQLLYELTSRCVKNSNKSPLWTHSVQANQWQKQNKKHSNRSDFQHESIHFLQPCHGLLSLTQSLSACPADLARCSTALPRGQGYPLGASLCWPGPLSAHGPSESQGMPAGSCCCWDTAHKDLTRTKEKVGWWCEGCVKL